MLCGGHEQADGKVSVKCHFFTMLASLTVEQESHTAGVIKVASNIADTLAMNHFDLVGVVLSVWVPHW